MLCMGDCVVNVECKMNSTFKQNKDHSIASTSRLFTLGYEYYIVCASDFSFSNLTHEPNGTFNKMKAKKHSQGKEIEFSEEKNAHNSVLTF